MPVTRGVPSDTQRRTMARAGRALGRVGLARPAFRLYERWLATRSTGEQETAPDGLPLPSPHLRVLVQGNTGVSGFLDSGRAAADSIRDAIGRAGVDLAQAGRLLDFGCGCGRVARHWADLEGVEVHGCDYNPELAAWCDAHLPFMQTTVNRLEPPLAYPDDQFDAIYLISVFTHLPVDQCHAWMAELTRVLKPGGAILFTTHGDATTGVLEPDERAAYDRGEPVTRYSETAGSNLCSAFHPQRWVEDELARGLDVRVAEPGGLPGLGDQDVYVVRAA